MAAIMFSPQVITYHCCKTSYLGLPRFACIHRVGQNHIYTVYMRFFGMEITKHTVIYSVYIQFWTTLCIRVPPGLVSMILFIWYVVRPPCLVCCAYTVGSGQICTLPVFPVLLLRKTVFFLHNLAYILEFQRPIR
jgi:hypothetical protein